MKKVILLQTDIGYFDDVLSSPSLPLNLLKLSVYLVDDHEMVIIDARRNGEWKSALGRELASGDVVCVGISAMLGESLAQGLEASAFVKAFSSGIPVIWGGTHPSITADVTLLERDIDVVVRGEGEQTFNRLVRRLESGCSYTDLEGISYRERGTGKIIHNPAAGLLDMKALPDVPYQLVDVRKYMPKMGGRKSLNYESSRGCPVGCPFCYNTITAGGSWRCLPAAKVVSDIKDLREHFSVEHIYFIDDNLFCDMDRLREIGRGLSGQKAGITWDTQGACLEDVARMSTQDLRILKDSGLVRLAIGVQSGSPRIRKMLDCRFTDDMVFEVNEKLRSFEIGPHYYFMAGFPGETPDERKMTVQLALKLLEGNKHATTSSFLCYSPWPGTELFRSAQEQYGLEAPQSLSSWTKEWDYSIAPWFSAKEKRVLHKLFLAGMLYDKKADWYSDSRLVKMISAAYRPVARFRVKHMFFKYMFEEKLIELGKSLISRCGRVMEKKR